MSKNHHWISDWLTEPSLGQYFRIHSSDASTNHNDPPLRSTKDLLKEHMVDSFFERALHHMDGSEQAEPSPVAPIQELSEGATIDLSVEEAFVQLESTDAIDTPPIDEEYLATTLSEVFDLPEGILPATDQEETITSPVLDEEHFIDVDEPAIHDLAPIELEEEVKNEQQFGYYIFAITLSQYEYELPGEELAEGFPLFVYGFGKIQAVLSEVPLNEYGEDALQLKLNDPTWFEETLKKHNSILSKIQTVASMVPMRICTICDTSDALTAFLNEHHNDFVNTLELIEGNQAWRFVITCNRRKLHLLTKKASNRVRAIQAEMSSKPAHEVSALQDRLETVLEEEARSVCKACIKHSHAILSGFASKNLIHSLSGDPVYSADMQDIFKCEYLISNQSTESFLNELQILKESYLSLGFELQVDGPFPPSQFTERKVLPSAEVNTLRHERLKRTTGTH